MCVESVLWTFSEIELFSRRYLHYQDMLDKAFSLHQCKLQDLNYTSLYNKGGTTL